MKYGYNYDPDPKVLHPEDYSPKVWKREPELRTYIMPRIYAWMIGNFHEEYSDFDPTPEMTNWDRNLSYGGRPDYSLEVNLYRQLVAALLSNDVEDRFQGVSLRLSWQQAMDIEYAINVMVRTMRGTNPNGHTLDFYPLNRVDEDKMPSDQELLWEKQRLRMECINQYVFQYPLEPAVSPDEMSEEHFDAYQAFKRHIKGTGETRTGP